MMVSWTQNSKHGTVPQHSRTPINAHVYIFIRDEVTQRLDKMYKLHIVEEGGPEARRLTLNFPGRTTIHELKTNVYYITNIPVRHQEWSGWPSGCDNDTNLAVCFVLLFYI